MNLGPIRFKTTRAGFIHILVTEQLSTCEQEVWLRHVVFSMLALLDGTLTIIYLPNTELLFLAGHLMN